MRDERLALRVEAIFEPDGTLAPKRIDYGDGSWDVDRILQSRKRCPRTVRAISPVEYRVVVQGREKLLYYEADTQTWFSVKEYQNA